MVSADSERDDQVGEAELAEDSDADKSPIEAEEQETPQLSATVLTTPGGIAIEASTRAVTSTGRRDLPAPSMKRHQSGPSHGGPL